jgi:hypothetical protein
MLFFFAGGQVFSSATWPSKILFIADENIYLFSSAVVADENTVLFSSAHVADESKPIFIDFTSSAYFRRGADENSYFRRHLAYFRRLLADENILFSCSEVDI